MAKCPACERDVATPFFMNMDAWRWLACPHCAAKLERKSPRYLVALSSFMLALIALGGLGHQYRIIASVLLVALMVAFLAATSAQLLRPELQLRKPLPKPEIELKINDPPN
jgi:hypothetical protein